MDGGVRGLLAQLAAAKNAKFDATMVGICEELCTVLCIGTEESLRGLDSTEFVRSLSEVLLMNSAIPELKVFAMRAVALILDSVPSTGSNPACAQEVVTLVLDQLNRADTTLQLAEELLKALEALSLDHPGTIMQDGRLSRLLLWVEGVSVDKERLLTRILALSVLTNVSSRLKPSDWKEVQGILPLLASAARNVLQHDADTAAGREEVDTTISRICLVVAHMVDRLSNCDAVFDAISSSGLVPTLLAALAPPHAGGSRLSPTQRSFILRVLSVMYTANPRHAIAIFIQHNVFGAVNGLVSSFCTLHGADSSAPALPALNDEEEARIGIAACNSAFVAEEASVCGVLDFLLFVLPPLPHNPLVEPDVLVPFHAWTWEDDFRCFSVFDELVCHEVEAEYSRQRGVGALKCVDIVIAGRSFTLRFAEMRKESRSARLNCPLYRDPVPGHFARCRIKPATADTATVSNPSPPQDDLPLGPQEGTDAAPRAEPAAPQAARSWRVGRSNRVHPAEAGGAPSAPGESPRPLRGLQAAGQDRLSHFSASHSSLDEDGRRGGGYFGRLLRRLSCCGGDAAEDADSTVSAADRKVIESEPCPEHRRGSGLQERRAANLAVESLAASSSPLFLGQLLTNILPALVGLLRATVNPYLTRDATVAIGRILNAVLLLLQPEGGVGGGGGGGAAAECEEHRACLQRVASDLSFATVLVMSTSADYSPIATEVGPSSGSQTASSVTGGVGDVGLSLYGYTLCAALLNVDLLLKIDGRAFADALQRNGVCDAFAKVALLPDVMQRRGNVGHRGGGGAGGGSASNDAASVTSSVAHSVAHGKRSIDAILAFTAAVEVSVAQFSTPDPCLEPLVTAARDVPPETRPDTEDPLPTPSPKDLGLSQSVASTQASATSVRGSKVSTSEHDNALAPVSLLSPSQSSVAAVGAGLSASVGQSASAASVIASIAAVYPNVQAAQAPALLQSLLALVESGKVTSYELMASDAVAIRFVHNHLKGILKARGGVRKDGASSAPLSRRSSAASSLSAESGGWGARESFAAAAAATSLQIAAQVHPTTVRRLVALINACCASFISQAAPDPSFFKALLNPRAQHNNGNANGAAGAINPAVPSTNASALTCSTHSGSFPQKYSLAASHYPLAMTLSASLQSASILNVIQERMARPLSVRCVYAPEGTPAGTGGGTSGDDDSVFTVSVYPFATFACLERWICMRKDERGNNGQASASLFGALRRQSGRDSSSSAAAGMGQVAAPGGDEPSAPAVPGLPPTAAGAVSVTVTSGSSTTSSSSSAMSPAGSAAVADMRSDLSVAAAQPRVSPPHLPPIEEDSAVSTRETNDARSVAMSGYTTRVERGAKSVASTHSYASHAAVGSSTRDSARDMMSVSQGVASVPPPYTLASSANPTSPPVAHPTVPGTSALAHCGTSVVSVISSQDIPSSPTHGGAQRADLSVGVNASSSSTMAVERARPRSMRTTASNANTGMLEPPAPSHRADGSSTQDVGSTGGVFGGGRASSFGANSVSGLASPELHASCPVHLPTRVVSPITSPVASGISVPAPLALPASSQPLQPPQPTTGAPSASSTAAHAGSQRADGDTLAPPVSGRLSQYSSGPPPEGHGAATTATAASSSLVPPQTDRASVVSRSSAAQTRITAASAPDDDVERISHNTDLGPSLLFSVDGHAVPTKRMTLLDAAVLFSHQGASMRRVLGQCCGDAPAERAKSADTERDRPSRTSSKVLVSKAMSLWNGSITVQVRRPPPAPAPPTAATAHTQEEPQAGPVFASLGVQGLTRGSAHANSCGTPKDDRGGEAKKGAPQEGGGGGGGGAVGAVPSTPPQEEPAGDGAHAKGRRGERARSSNTAAMTGLACLQKGFGGSSHRGLPGPMQERLELCLELKTLLLPLAEEVGAKQADALHALHDQRLSSAAIHDLHVNIVPAAFPSLAPLAEVTADPRRWVRGMLMRFPHLYPLPLRVQHFNALVTGCRLALLRNMHSSVLPLGWAGGWSSSSVRAVVGAQWLRSSGSLWARPANKRQKAVVSRPNVLHCAEVLLQRHAATPLPLDVFFEREPGTGMGPTTEFFTLVSRAVQQKSLRLWRGSAAAEGQYVTSPNGLFPDVLWCLPSHAAKQRALQRFVFVGRLIGRALKDAKTLDIHLSPVLVDLLMGVDVLRNASASLGLVEPDYERSLQQIASLASSSLAPADTDEGGEMDVVACLGLAFTLPGHDDIPLVPGGESQPVNLSNYKQYIDMVRCAFLSKGIEQQMQSLMEGLNEVFPSHYMSLFTASELTALLCGKHSSTEKVWETPEQLFNDVVCDHGYTKTSQPVVQLMEVVAEMTATEQRHFLSFISGSPRMPLGGLVPKITVVRRGVEFEGFSDGDLMQDVPLPSVNTCFHYLKLPAYSCKTALREKLVYAINEGRESFELS